MDETIRLPPVSLNPPNPTGGCQSHRTYVSHMPHHLKENRSSDKHGLCTMRPMSRVFRHLIFKEYFTVKAHSVTISRNSKAFLAIVCLGIQPSYLGQNVLVLSKGPAVRELRAKLEQEKGKGNRRVLNLKIRTMKRELGNQVLKEYRQHWLEEK
jgi:hypothetical protein